MRYAIAILALTHSLNVYACPISEVPDRIDRELTVNGSRSFELMGRALERPELLNQDVFQAQLKAAMREAGIDAKQYLSPEHKSGPIPSLDAMRTWGDDLKRIITCD